MKRLLIIFLLTESYMLPMYKSDNKITLPSWREIHNFNSQLYHRAVMTVFCCMNLCLPQSIKRCNQYFRHQTFILFCSKYQTEITILEHWLLFMWV